MPPNLHLSRKHHRQLVSLFKTYLPEVEIWAYGSRVKGTSHAGSDLDLVLRTKDLIPILCAKMSVFIDALRESNLPFLVQVQDWNTLPKTFQGEIERQYVALFSPFSDKKRQK